MRHGRRYNGALVRALIQRVSSAEVTVGGRQTGRIDRGLLVLLGVGKGDSEKEAAYLSTKTAGLRIFEGPDGRMKMSVRDVGGEVLVVPQFTLYGDMRRGLRPSFDSAASPEVAKSLYERYVDLLRGEGLGVATGDFGAFMRVELVNQGPVTILLDSADRR